MRNIRQDSQLNTPKLDDEQRARLDAARSAWPRHDASGFDWYGSSRAHARALRAHDPELTYEALAVGSGVRITDVKREAETARASSNDRRA